MDQLMVQVVKILNFLLSGRCARISDRYGVKREPGPCGCAACKMKEGLLNATKIKIEKERGF